MKPKAFTMHLVSDATGSTLSGLANAALAQFDGIEPEQKLWPLIRSQAQLERVIDKIETNPGPVLYTIIEPKLRRMIETKCQELQVPAMPILEPVIRELSAYLGLPIKGIPGLQHELNEEYFKRMGAIDFALSFDDGQSIHGIEDADVIVVGVSRTSKTPTCVFLARRGYKAANIPLVPGVPFPEKVLKLKKPMFVGLTESPERLHKIRHTRLKSDMPLDEHENKYLDLDAIKGEVREARRLFNTHGWPVIDVTKRSVEETAAEIISMLQQRQDEKKS